MKPTDCVKLEKDLKLKKKYLNRTPWWKSFLIVAPSLLLFMGLFALLYLTKNDMLLTVYAIPFVVLFLLGTIWLKAVKKHIQKAILEKEDAFKVCMAALLMSEGGYAYFVFDKGQKRHNEFHLKQIAEKYVPDEALLQASKKQAQEITDESDIPYFLIAYPLRTINKHQPSWADKQSLALFYIDQRNILVIDGKDIS